MVNYDDATDKLIVSKEDIHFVETAAYLCLEAIKPDCGQDDFSFPDGLVDRMVDAAYLRNEALNQAQRDAIDRVMPVLNYYSIIEYGPYAYAGYNGTEKDITVGSRIVNIGKGCFRESFIDSITFNGRLGMLPNDLLLGSYVKTVNFTNTLALPGVTGNSVFESCRQLKTLTLPSNLQKISSRFCYNCVSLEGISFPSASGIIEDYAFYGCAKIPSVSIPRNVTRIGSYTFANCTGLTSVSIGLDSYLTMIDDHAFKSCSSLTSIRIPAGVTDIGTYAFNGCSSMTEMYFMSSTPPMLGSSYALPYQNANLKIYIPAGSLEAYQTAQYWKLSSIKNKLVEMEA